MVRNERKKYAANLSIEWFNYVDFLPQIQILFIHVFFLRINVNYKSMKRPDNLNFVSFFYCILDFNFLFLIFFSKCFEFEILLFSQLILFRLSAIGSI